MAGILREKFPERPIPKKETPKLLLYIFGPMIGISWKFIKLNVGIDYRFDNSKSIRLGVQYTPVQDTLTDHTTQLIEDGLI